MTSITPAQLQRALRASWSKTTCWPGAWNPKNPAAGHCRVTATVVQKLLGGKILHAMVWKDPLYTHFWNKLPSGREYDFTRDQFPPNFHLPPGKQISLTRVRQAAALQKAFPVLLRRVQKYFANKKTRRATFAAK